MYIINCIIFISERVSRLNPSWQINATDEDKDNLFSKAVQLTSLEFINYVTYLLDDWLPARKIVEEAVSNRCSEIIVFKEYCPFEEHLHDMENENPKLSGIIKFAVFKDSQKGYRVRSIPIFPINGVSRKLLPKSWRGLKDEELITESKISGCMFVHYVGFIGGNETENGAIEMACKALIL